MAQHIGPLYLSPTTIAVVFAHISLVLLLHSLLRYLKPILVNPLGQLFSQ